MEQRSLSPRTLAAQGLGEADPASGAIVPVISLSTNYEQQPDGSYPNGRVYTRADNPTSEHAERLLAALEGGGCACALFASGMAAATAVFQALRPVPDDLLRLSAGIEDPGDLIADLEAALDAAGHRPAPAPPAASGEAGR